MNIYLDVDEVVCNFIHGIEKKYPDLKNRDVHSYDLPSIIDWGSLNKDAFFWLSLPVLDRPNFKVSGYISHRQFPTYITSFWLYINGFNICPVTHVNSSVDKLDILLNNKCDLYIDDKPETFLQCEQGGLNVFLYDRPWNQHINTDKRIYKLKELETYGSKTS